MPSTAIVASQILDSGLTGRQLVQSATKSEAITVLGLDPSNYALLDSNNTFTGTNTFDDDVTVNAFLSVGSAEFSSVTINDDFFASNAEFSGSVEFTDLITGVGGEHQGDLRITDADLIVSGSGKIDAVDGDFSGTLNVPADGLIQNVVGVSGDTDRAYLQNHTSTNAATGTVSVWSKLYTEGVYDHSNPFLTQWRMGLDGSYNLLFDKQGILFQNNGSLQGGFFQADYADPKIGFIGVGHTSDLGLETFRWQQSWLEDVSFDGTISGEVGGSYKLYNLGTEGDIDKEYLESSWSTNLALIGTKASGNGVVRDLQLGTAATKVLLRPASNQIWLYSNSNPRILCSSGGVGTGGNVYPFTNDADSLGLATNRWESVYSVDGDFSGTVTAAGVDMNGDIDFKVNGYIRRSGVAHLRFGSRMSTYIDLAPSSDNTYALGVDGNRWSNVASVDGSFSGNLVSEAGGGLKLYNLGTVGDTDTEYVETSWVSNEAYIFPQHTGTGVGRTLRIGSGTSYMKVFHDSTIQFYRGGSVRIGMGATKTDFYGNAEFQADVDVLGNLNVETGGSYTLYNLGTEGDTDTEFVSMAWDNNDFKITANSTGSGTVQDIDIAGKQVALRHNSGSSISTRLSVDSNSVKVWRNLYGGTDGLYACGTTSNRWSNVYSVDGDFSGVVTTLNVTGTNNLYLQNSVDTASVSIAGSGGVTLRAHNAIYQQFTPTGVNYRKDCIPTFDGSTNLGLDTNRWGATYSVNGSFSGNLNIESGGSQRLYNLGTEGDADTEYIEMLWTSNICKIRAVSTGNGTERRIDFEGSGIRYKVAGITVADISAGDFRLYSGRTIRPLLDNDAAVGKSGQRFSNVYSYDGSFSGNLNVETGSDGLRFYSTGTDGDTDTSFLNVGFDSAASAYKVAADRTGAGLLRQLWFDASQIRTYESGTLLTIAEANELRMYGTLVPSSDGLRSVGSTSKRFGTGYFVEGDFSGTVTAGNLLVGVTASTTGAYDSEIHNRLLFKTLSSRAFTAKDSSDVDVFNINTSQSVVTVYNDLIVGSNLNVESGGSYKLYNLGTEGDTDTEYLGIDADANTFRILSTVEGTGVQRDIRLGGYIGTAYRGIRIQPASGGMQFIYNNANRLSINSTTTNITTATTVTQDQRPALTDTYTNGTSSFRWSNVASVDGDFSGTVRFGSWEDNGLTGYVETVVPTADGEPFWIDRNWSGGSSSGRVGLRTDYNSAGTAHNQIAVTPTLVEIQLGNALKAVWQVSGNLHRLNMNFRPYVDSTYDNGFTNARWLTTYSVNGSFSGNLNVEVGGSYKLYRLGTEGDADTSFFEISNTGSDFLISGKKTGAGTSSTVTLGYEGGDRLEIGFSAITVRNAAFQPDSDTSRNLGVPTRRWARTYTNTVMTDVQTITAASDSLVSTDHTVLCDCTSNSIAIAIPASSTGTESNRYEIKKIDSTANTVTITPDSPATIDGAASQTLNFQHQSITLVSDGSNWFIV